MAGPSTKQYTHQQQPWGTKVRSDDGRDVEDVMRSAQAYAIVSVATVVAMILALPTSSNHNGGGSSNSNTTLHKLEGISSIERSMKVDD